MRGLCFSIPGHGHVNPSLALVHQLVARGEEIDYYCTEEFREKIEQTGATFKVIPDYLIVNNNLVHFNTLGVFADLMETTMIVMPYLLEHTKTEAYDYILTDLYAIWGLVLGEQLKIPTIRFCPSFVQVKGMKQPPHSLLQALSSPRKSAPHLLRISQFFKKIKQQYSLAHIHKLDDFLMKILPNLCLVLTLPELQPQPHLFPSQYKFIGPSINPAVRAEVVDFDTERLKNTSVIYISLGSVLSNKRFYNKCIKAFSNTHFLVIINISVHLDVKDFPAPANFIIRNYIPQLAILPEVNLFITHGGMNSAHEGLFYGVPMLVVPQVSDQFMVADAIHQKQLGQWVNERFFSAKRLLQVARKIIASPLIKRNLRATSKQIQDNNSAQKAADLLLNSVQGTLPS
ncbi:MAG: macrolide family glycosyltransferase [Aureispira sp.]